MHLTRVGTIASAVIAMTAIIAIQSCSGVRNKTVPSSRNHWRVFCQPEGSQVFFDIYASYEQALNSDVCNQHGGVRKVWDLDLVKSGWVAPTSFVTADLGNRRAVEEAMWASKGFPTRTIQAAPKPFCAAARCQGSSKFMYYKVTYMGVFNPSHNWFNCQAVGLFNIPKTATNVYGAALNPQPAVCPVGVVSELPKATTGEVKVK